MIPQTSENRSNFIGLCANNPVLNDAISSPALRYAFHNMLWAKKKEKASMLTANLMDGETIYGPNLDLSEDEILDTEDRAISAANKQPYGDVAYADPGYQKDGKKRYPIDNAEHTRAAHSYFSKPGNSGKYTPAQQAKIRARIASAWRKFIDPKGPPSDQK